MTSMTSCHDLLSCVAIMLSSILIISLSFSLSLSLSLSLTLSLTHSHTHTHTRTHTNPLDGVVVALVSLPFSSPFAPFLSLSTWMASLSLLCASFSFLLIFFSLSAPGLRGCRSASCCASRTGLPMVESHTGLLAGGHHSRKSVP